MKRGGTVGGWKGQRPWPVENIEIEVLGEKRVKGQADWMGQLASDKTPTVEWPTSVRCGQLPKWPGSKICGFHAVNRGIAEKENGQSET